MSLNAAMLRGRVMIAQRAMRPGRVVFRAPPFTSRTPEPFQSVEDLAVEPLPPLRSEETLLTVDDHTDLLRMDKRTVYDHKNELSGFYPLGIKVLRFNREAIHVRLLGQAVKAEGC
jgi:hypothetical protein